MPPAVIAIAQVAAMVAIKTFVTSKILAAILMIAVSVVGSVLIKKATNKKLSQGQELALKLDPSLPRQIAVGRTATGGSVVWAFTYTDDSKKPNRYLVRIIELSDYPITNVISVRSGKDTLSFAGDLHTGWRTCDQFRTAKGVATLIMRVYRGSATPTADANLISWSGGLWTANHKGTNIAYVAYRMDFDPDAYPNGEPDLIFELDGAKIYDDRFDSTKPGGSGSQRLNNPATWQFSRNACTITAQALRGFYTNGKRIIGVGAEERDLSTSMLFSAYNIADETVTSLAGSIPRYRAGLMLSAQEPAQAYLEDLQQAFDGRIVDRGGSITILPGAIRIPIMHIEDPELVWTEERSWQPKAALSDLTNYVSGTFVDEENGYQEKPFPPFANSTWESDDGGERFTTNIALRAVTSWSQTQRIARRIHQSSRFQAVIAFVLPIAGLELEQGDWITISSARLGITNQTFEILQCAITPDLKFALIARQTSSTIDSWSAAVDERPRNDSTWDPPEWPLLPPTVTLASITRTDPRTLQQEFGLRITLTDLPDGTLNRSVILELALQGDEANPIRITSLPAVNQVYERWGVSANSTYALRAISSDMFRFSEPSPWVYQTTDSALPPSLDGIYDDFTYDSVTQLGLAYAITGTRIDVQANPASPGGRSVELGQIASGSNTVTLIGRPVAYAPEDLWMVRFDIQWPVTSPHASTRTVLGVACYDADGNNLPTDAGTHAYVAGSHFQNTVSRTTFYGFFRGAANVGAGNGVGNAAPSLDTPSPLPTGTVWVRPIIIANLNTVNPSNTQGRVIVHEASLERIEDITLVWRGNWDIAVVYSINDAVRFGTRTFASRRNNNLGNQPPSSSTSNTWWTFVVQDGATGATGAPGADAQLIRLAPSSQIFRFSPTGAANPSTQTITLTLARQNIVGTSVWTTSPTVTLGGSGDTRTLSIADFGNNASVEVTVTVGALQDKVTIYRLQDARDQNLIDPGTWTVSSGVAPPGFNLYALAAENSIVLGDGISHPLGPGGSSELLWRGEQQNAASQAGGFNTNFPVMPDKTYRFSVWIYCSPAGPTNGTLFLGANTTTPNIQRWNGSAWVDEANPYFISGQGRAGHMGVWRLFVGVLNGKDFTGTTEPVSGIYDTEGRRIVGGIGPLRTVAGRNVELFRTFAFVGSDGIITYFCRPRVDEVNGNEPSIHDLLQARPITIAQSLVGLLTNEAHTVPASTGGVVSSFAGASGNFRVFYGGEDVTSASTFSTQSNPQGLTQSISSAGAYSVTASGSWAAGTNVATVTYRATYITPGGATITNDKIFTLTKSREGAQGVDGVDGAPGVDGVDGVSVAEVSIYRRASTQPATATGGSLNFSTGVLTPPTGASVTIPSGELPVWVARGVAITTIVGGSATPTWAAYARAFEDGQAVDAIFKRSATEPATPAPSSGVPATWYSSVGDVPAGSNPLWASFGERLSAISNWVWQQPVRVEGEDGADGADGAPGVDGVSRVEAAPFSVAAFANGNVKSGALPQERQLGLRRGPTDITAAATWSVLGTPTNITITVNSTGKVTLTGISANSGSGIVRAIHDSINYDFVISASKVLDGLAGSSATVQPSFPSTGSFVVLGTTPDMAQPAGQSVIMSCSPILWESSLGTVGCEFRMQWSADGGASWTTASPDEGAGAIVGEPAIITMSRTISAPSETRLIRGRILGLITGGANLMNPSMPPLFMSTVA